MMTIRKIGLLSLAALLVVSAVPVSAQAVRGQAYAVQCIGFAGGHTLGHVTGYIHMASTNSKYNFNADCDSDVNGGQAVISGPNVIDAAGVVTSITMLVTTTRYGAATFYREKPHSFQTSNGFFSGTFLADPATSTGEVHVLISVP